MKNVIERYFQNYKNNIIIQQLNYQLIDLYKKYLHIHSNVLRENVLR